jgi:hypothetical protein
LRLAPFGASECSLVESQQMIPIVQRGVKADLPDSFSLRPYRSSAATKYNEMTNGVPPVSGRTPFVLAVDSVS